MCSHGDNISHNATSVYSDYIYIYIACSQTLQICVLFLYYFEEVVVLAWSTSSTGHLKFTVLCLDDLCAEHMYVTYTLERNNRCDIILSPTLASSAGQPFKPVRVKIANILCVFWWGKESHSSRITVTSCLVIGSPHLPSYYTEGEHYRLRVAYCKAEPSLILWRTGSSA